MKLLLFDIDGTIMDSGGAGVRSLDHAFSEVFSIDDAFRDISMAGKTDLQIIKEGLVQHGFPAGNGLVPAVMEAYLRRLRIEIGNGRKHLKPGVREALSLLHGRADDCVLGLLTGNVEQGARIKLGSFALNGYFPAGAFGDDDEDRNRLLPIARRRFEELYGKAFDFGECVIIGDTPRDVYCAKPYGASCIAVATGPYRADALVRAGADVVFEDLSDTQAFLRALSIRGS
ncbi:MAG: HAD family hydrolase [Nitrospirota bacterium]